MHAAPFEVGSGADADPSRPVSRRGFAVHRVIMNLVRRSRKHVWRRDLLGSKVGLKVNYRIASAQAALSTGTLVFKSGGGYLVLVEPPEANQSSDASSSSGSAESPRLLLLFTSLIFPGACWVQIRSSAAGSRRDSMFQI